MMNKPVVFGALSGALIAGIALAGYHFLVSPNLGIDHQTAASIPAGDSGKGSRVPASTDGVLVAQAQNTATDGGVSENYQDWTVLCQPPTGAGQRCLIAQEIKMTDSGERLILLSVERDAATGQPRAGIVLTVNGRLLNRISLTIEGTEVAAGPYAACDETSCRTALALPAEAVEMMKRGNQGTVDMAAEDGQPIRLPISLAGFTASWNRMLQISG